jgi:hypothetical protein
MEMKKRKLLNQPRKRKRRKTKQLPRKINKHERGFTYVHLLLLISDCVIFYLLRELIVFYSFFSSTKIFCPVVSKI